ncbi:IS66 family transposase [uncultured Photobacterium sp.]|uniref:IS66 family transposase n=1 Tax=uncultured Photobacterium sp. TaxID=173973 RepID=UPI00262E2D85|nr:IS66 family transposase [uncultured Photobacterium sp.]
MGAVPAGTSQTLPAAKREVPGAGLPVHEAESLTDTGLSDDEPEMETVTYTRKRGRKPINPDLPREVIKYDLAEDEKICPYCQGALHAIGVESSEQLEIIPKQVKVLRHERKKYACRHCENHGEGSKIIIASMPRQPLPGSRFPAAASRQPLPGSIATAGTLATVAVSKYADGLPLYRIEKELARVGVDIQRTTLANWMIKTAELLSPIYLAMRRALLKEVVIHGDETTLQVLKEPGKKAQSKSYLWAYSSPEQSTTPVVLFEYQPGRGHAYPKAFLDGYEGTIMTDGYSAWRMLETVTHLGCWAHARRKFKDALDLSPKKTGQAKQALSYIQKLYAIENKAQSLSASERYAMRQKDSIPILESFHGWLNKAAVKLLPQSPMGKAVSYALKQWVYLEKYVEDGYYPIDNNRVEREIRSVATGRKAWLFADTQSGANASATLFSIMLSCRANGVEPYAYLRHVLTELPQREEGCDVSDLLPYSNTTTNS